MNSSKAVVQQQLDALQCLFKITRLQFGSSLLQLPDEQSRYWGEGWINALKYLRASTQTHVFQSCDYTNVMTGGKKIIKHKLLLDNQKQKSRDKSIISCGVVKAFI